METLLSTHTLDLDRNYSFSLSMTKLSITSLIRLFKGSKSLAEGNNSTQSEFIVERENSVFSFDNKNRGELEKLPQIQSYSYHKWGLEDFHVPTVPQNIHQHKKSTTILLDIFKTGPFYLVTSRYQHILITAVSCDALESRINLEH